LLLAVALAFDPHDVTRNKLKPFRQARLYNLYSQLSEICMSQLRQCYADLGHETVVFGIKSSR